MGLHARQRPGTATAAVGGSVPLAGLPGVDQPLFHALEVVLEVRLHVALHALVHLQAAGGNGLAGCIAAGCLLGPGSYC